MITTYEFYKSNYKGEVIPDEKTFDRIAVEASAYVNYITLNKAENCPCNLRDKVNMAVCAVAEIIYQQNTIDNEKEMLSETVANHTQTFGSNKKTEKEREIEKMRKVNLYLSGTGLLYRGIR